MSSAELARAPYLQTMTSRVPDRHRLEIEKLNLIGSVISDYIQLSDHGSGSGTQDGVCPFHQDRWPRPQLRVQVVHGSFHCFGCGRGGDVFTFVSTIEKTTYDAAVRQLAAALTTPGPEPSQELTCTGQGTRRGNDGSRDRCNETRVRTAKAVTFIT